MKINNFNLDIQVPYDEELEEVKNNAKNGDADAQLKLGDIYFEGVKTYKDYKQSFQWYKESAYQGNIEACYKVGLCYANGYGTISYVKDAINWLKKAADTGLSAAQYELSQVYFGKIANDENEGVRYLLLSANANYPAAISLLGYWHDNGKYVEQNKTKAIDCYTRASKLGSAVATYNLALCYYHGNGVAKDLNRAFEIMSKAAEMGDDDAQCWLGIMYEEGAGTPKNQIKAVEWFKKSAEQLNPVGMYNLALCYEFGQGVPTSAHTALKWCRLAAQKGDESAKERIPKLIEQEKAQHKPTPDEIYYGFTPCGNPELTKVDKQKDPLYLYLQKHYLKDDYVLGTCADYPNPENSSAYVKYAYAICFFREKHENGSEYPKNYDYIRQAADEGYAPAQFAYGVYSFMNADGYVYRKNNPSYATSVKYFSLAMDQEFPKAVYVCSEFIRRGIYFERSEDLANHIVYWAYLQGDEDAAKVVNNMDKSAREKIVDEIYKLDMKSFCEKSSVEEILDLANQTTENEDVLYILSFIKDKDGEGAYEFAKRCNSSTEATQTLINSAKLGYTQAQYEVGYHALSYQPVPDGSGIRLYPLPSADEGVEFLKMASEQDHLPSALLLAHHYEKTDKAQAITYYKKAHALGDEESAVTLGALLLDADAKKGFDLLNHASQKFPDAYYHLGVCYLKGLGCEKDETKADYYFEIAGKHNGDNYYLASRLYATEGNVPRDFEKIATYLRKAVDWYKTADTSEKTYSYKDAAKREMDNYEKNKCPHCGKYFTGQQVKALLGFKTVCSVCGKKIK